MTQFLISILITLSLSTPKSPAEALQNPVVLIKSGSQTGTGFLVGFDREKLYIITALHVLEDPEEINLEFLSDHKTTAKSYNSSGFWDLAVITCQQPEGFTLPPSFKESTTPFAIHDKVTTIGHPLSNDWAINKRDEIFALEHNETNSFFTITPQGIAAGSSGGPVLNAENEFIGMVLKDGDIAAECLNGTQIMTIVKKWGVPLNLMIGVDKKHIHPEKYNDPLAGDMILIGGGNFAMGSNQIGGYEKPVHNVNISDFYLGKYEVTVAQFKKFMDQGIYKTDAEKIGYSMILNLTPKPGWVKKNGVDWRYDSEGNLRPQSNYNHPVVHISWNDAKAYCTWLSEETGKEYRLPSESEWEYAAGNGTRHNLFSWGDQPPVGKKGGNIADEAYKRKFPPLPAQAGYNDGFTLTAPVGSFQANAFGLYDMTGNVFEFCEDWFHESYEGAPIDGSAWLSPPSDRRVVRGGSWSGLSFQIMVAKRNSIPMAGTIRDIGFRVARSL